MKAGELLLDYARLDELAAAGAGDYAAASPFPHAVIDDLLPAPVVDAVLKRFPREVHAVKPDHEDVPMDTGKMAQFRKGFLSRETLVDPLIRRLYWELNSGPFIEFLETLTGCDRLLADPYLQGGGIHEILPGGFLRVHADFNKHAKLRLQRKLNVLVYLNRDWRPEYGGNLELWDEEMTEMALSVEPLAGRCVVFSTTSTSFHGHPHPLACPDGMSRKSIALYYYAREEGNAPHETLWQELPGE